MSDTAALIDRLGQTALECRALIREMHEAEQSLKAAVRDARAIVGDLREAADKAIDEDIEEKVRVGLEAFGEHTRAAMASTSAKIISEFDKLAKPLLASFEDIKQTQIRIARELRVDK